MLLSHIDQWLKRHTTVAYLILIVLGIVGAWLVGIFEAETNPSKEITALDLALSFGGLVVFCAAIVGVFVLYSRNRKPMNAAQGVVWERVRAKGKSAYVRNFILRASTPVVASFLILFLLDRDRRTNLQIYVALTAGIIAVIIYAAFRFWDYYEAEYRSLQSKPQHNKSLDRSGGGVFCKMNDAAKVE